MRSAIAQRVLEGEQPTLSARLLKRSPMRKRPFSEDDNQFLKFHGSYQQDDRDLRKTGKKYIMMVRGRIPAA